MTASPTVTQTVTVKPTMTKHDCIGSLADKPNEPKSKFLGPFPTERLRTSQTIGFCLFLCNLSHLATQNINEKFRDAIAQWERTFKVTLVHQILVVNERGRNTRWS